MALGHTSQRTRPCSSAIVLALSGWKPSRFSVEEMLGTSQKHFELSYTFSVEAINSVCSILQHVAKAVSSPRQVEGWAIRLGNVDSN